MQLRCTYCQTMFAISRDEMLAALEHLEEQKLKYYDAHCPKCRRANRVERLKLELAYPNWKSDLKALAKQAAAQAPEAKAPAKAVGGTSAAYQPPAGETALQPAAKTPAKKPAAAAKEKGSAPAGKPAAAPKEKGTAPAKKPAAGAKTKSGVKQP